MLRRRSFYTFFLSVLFFALTSISQPLYAEGVEYIEKNGIEVQKPYTEKVEGKIVVNGKTSKENIKLMVKKGNTKEWYTVEVNSGSFTREIWLSAGKGTYTIAVMIKESDTKYSYGPEFEVENTVEINKFLAPAQDIDSNNEDIINLSREIMKEHDTDASKAKALYDWVVSNIKYDYEKYKNHVQKNFNNKYGSLLTLKTKKGVCYDYAVLTAALGRAAGLQVKVVEGEAQIGEFKGLHAWNEIYCSEENRWINLDTTFGATTGKNCFDIPGFEKTHQKEKEY